jgi:hypothetical protein
MTRISSLFVATTLAILPIGAIAQPTVAPAKTTSPTALTTTAPATAPVTGKTAASTTADVGQPAKTSVKHGTKTEVHGMNGVNTPNTRTGVPAKTTEPAKS